MLKLVWNATQNIQAMCLTMHHRVGSLETEMEAINAKLAACSTTGLSGAFQNVTQLLSENLEKKLHALSQQTNSHLAKVQTAVKKVQTRDVSLAKRVAKLIKVGSVFFCTFY